MFETCYYFGIDPEAIERADRIVETTLKQYNLENWSESLHNYARISFECNHNVKDLTDSIIQSLFDELAELLEYRTDIDTFQIEKQINGMQSSFSVREKALKA